MMGAPGSPQDRFWNRAKYCCPPWPGLLVSPRRLLQLQNTSQLQLVIKLQCPKETEALGERVEI